MQFPPTLVRKHPAPIIQPIMQNAREYNSSPPNTFRFSTSEQTLEYLRIYPHASLFVGEQ
jgi:hypothetical protein